VSYSVNMLKKKIEEITSIAAAERLHLTRKSVHRMIERGAINARMVTEAPKPYYLIAVDDKFLAEEAARNEKALDQSVN
jgi:hypothetical protein